MATICNFLKNTAQDVVFFHCSPFSILYVGKTDSKGTSKKMQEVKYDLFLFLWKYCSLNDIIIHILSTKKQQNFTKYELFIEKIFVILLLLS